MDEKKQAVGIFTLPVGMYCDVECLNAYDVIVAEKHIRIHFPQYKEPEDKNLDMGSVIAPEVAKTLRKGGKEFEWGRINHFSETSVGGIINLIVVVCEEKDAQALYETFNQWMGRFLEYCFLSNKQFRHAVDITALGGNRLELVGRDGYIHSPKPQVISMTLNYEPEETYLKKKHIEKAIEFASSSRIIRPEYEFMQLAYKAEQIHEHKLSIINACSALESCLLNQIEQYCIQHRIETDILTKKYKYLGELIELDSRFDSGFSPLKEELKEKVSKARNAALHFNQNAAPNRETAMKCIETVEKALCHFYDDFAG